MLSRDEKPIEEAAPSPDIEFMSIQIQRHVVEALDLWRAKQNDLPSRSEAIQRLIACAATGMRI